VRRSISRYGHRLLASRHDFRDGSEGGDILPIDKGPLRRLKRHPQAATDGQLATIAGFDLHVVDWAIL
jgi:hypothetical protein